MANRDSEPHYGEETDQEPTYPADGQTAEGAGADDELNPDLHGAARKVTESDDPMETPGGG